MDANACVRCGLPEHWQLKIRARLVFAAIVLAAVIGFVAGRMA